MIERFVIFGASGDLTARYLLPALCELHEAGLVPDALEVVGVDLPEWSRDEFRARVGKRLGRWASHVSETERAGLLGRLDYVTGDATDPEHVRKAIGGAPSVIYLALPPGLLPDAIEAIASAAPPEGSLIVVEKPFGDGLSSARRLNRLLHEHFPEQAVFRIDHFIHKQTVQNLLGLRFANRILEPVWNSVHIEKIEIVWDETLALEGRAAYYDRSGALRDMIQNHLLQVLALIAMEPPASLSERDLRDAKVQVLRAVPTMDEDAVKQRTVRARYTSGRIGDRIIPSYADEDGIEPERGTETFAQVELRIETWRWAGVPFVLRSGKALGRDRSAINVYFRPVPHLAFGPRAGAEPNVLHICFDPDRLVLTMNINGPGDPFDLEQVALDVDLAEEGLPAYARLLHEVLDGDPTLSIRADEAEESWRIVEPILETWEKNVVPLLEYQAGSSGPASK